MQLKKKVQIQIRKRGWQKQGVNLAVVYQEVKAEAKSKAPILKIVDYFSPNRSIWITRERKN
jgi:hypothetical protein